MEQIDVHIVAATVGPIKLNILPLLEEYVTRIEAAEAGWLEPNIMSPHELDVPQINKVVDVDDLLFSQPGCSSYVQCCRRSLQTLIDALSRWEILPLTAPFMTLQEVECICRGELRMHLLDNRRLYRSKVHHEHVRAAGWRVRVNVR